VPGELSSFQPNEMPISHPSSHVGQEIMLKPSSEACHGPPRRFSNANSAKIPPIPPRIARVVEKIKLHGHTSCLTEDEAIDYARGLPVSQRKYVGISPSGVAATLDNGSLTLKWLAHCRTRDLNNAVYHWVGFGEADRSMRLIRIMARWNRTNQHTFAAFFKACSDASLQEIALDMWGEMSKVWDHHINNSWSINACSCF
jgi:hypothetical protein